MKTRKAAGMTGEEKVYDDLRQAYGVPRSPAMMKLLKFLYPTLEEAEVGRLMENQYSGGKPKTDVELAQESGKDLKQVREILARLSPKIIIKWRDREGQPGVREYFNTGSKGLKNAWGHVGKNDAEGETFRGLINKVLEEQSPRVPKFKPRTLMIDQTIHADTKTLPYEIASEIIKWKAKNGTTIALMYCNCREYQKNATAGRIIALPSVLWPTSMSRQPKRPGVRVRSSMFQEKKPWPVSRSPSSKGWWPRS